jgi:hypothetical protein
MHAPEAERVKQDLEREFQSIPPLPQASSKGHYGKADRMTVYVLNVYETSLSPAEVVSYYESELPKKGWRKCGEPRKEPEWTGTHGETSSIYCKKFYKAYVVFDEDEAGSTRRFDLRLEWD